MKIEVLGVGTGLCPELGNVSLLEPGQIFDS